MTTETGTGRDPLTDRGRRTRQGLVAAARAVFEEKGFSATRMGDIAEQAGVSHGTVYTYFNTKEDLLAASVTQLVADIRASIRTTESDDPVKRVWNANYRYLTAYLSHARLMRVVEGAGATDPRFAEIVAELRRTHASRVAGQVRKLQSADLIPLGIEPDGASRALCAMVEGFARNWTEQVGSDLVGSTRTLTRLWVNSLGLDAGSLGLDAGFLGSSTGPTADPEGRSGTGPVSGEEPDPGSSTGLSAVEQESGAGASRRPRESGTAHSNTTQSGTARESRITPLETDDAVHART